jgi:pilus assembly protein CpaB
MNRRSSRILFLAFIVAVISSYFVYRLARRQMSTPVTPATTKFITASHDLGIGTVIRDADLSTRELVGSLPKGAVTSKDGLIGRGVISAVYQGEPIMENRLAAAGSGGGLAATIRPGMRACAVKVDEVVGVAGFVVPGMRVDVLVSGTGPGASASEGAKVRTLLQNIEVLSAGTNIQKDNEGKPVQVQVVNLLVTPEQAELLSLASNQTKIQLVLRNPLDNDTTKTPGVALNALFNDGRSSEPKPVVRRNSSSPPPPPAVAAPAPPRVFLVEVLNGNKRSEEKFAAPEDHATASEDHPGSENHP